MKKFIFFRNDRLGDFLILTSIIKSIKEKYKDSHITVVCSPLNYSLVKKYKIINQVYLHSKKNSVFKKISLLRRINNSNYHASFAVDGKSFSNFCNFLIKSKYKLGLVYNYKIFNFWFTKPNFFYKYFIFDKYETFTSKKDLTNIEHLPTKLISLANHFKLNLKTKKNYYFDVSLKNKKSFKKFYAKFINKKYVLFHFDEKWSDINHVDNKLLLNLLKLQRRIKIKIIITTFKNKNKYFLNLKKQISENKKNKNILLVENSSLPFFERLINHSICSISCHSGFLVQMAGANSSNLIDIIHKKDYNWYSSWKPKNTKHKFIFKSNIDKIFMNIEIALKSYKNV